MSLYKDKRKNQPPIITLLEDKVQQMYALENNCFYYPLIDVDVKMVKDYFFRKYKAIVEPSYKSDGAIMYKFYGFKEVKNPNE